MIIRHAMVMKMMLNDYVMISYPCCCQFIWVPALISCWVMVYSLWFNSLCVDRLWTYKSETVEDTGRGHTGGSSYGGYSGDSGGGYTARDGTGGCIVYTADGSCTGGGYTGDGLYVGYSGKGENYCGSYRGYDKSGDGDKQVVYRKCDVQKNFHDICKAF